MPLTAAEARALFERRRAAWLAEEAASHLALFADETVTAYDSAYLALAEALAASLITLAARLSRARGHRARVEVVSAA